MTLDSSMVFRPGEQALVEPPEQAREHARELAGRLAKRGLRASDAPDIGTPAGVMTVAAQRVDVHPYVGRLVVLLPSPRDTEALYWHWQRPYSGRRWIGARWFQAFCPATEPNQAADAIVGAIKADMRARSRSAHIPAAQTGGDAEFEREFLIRAGRPLHLLVYRTLALLDSVEKEVEDTVLLHELFKVDHLTTRTLRGLERLAVLGGTTARKVNAPLKLATVMRQAVAQIEHYRRVRVQVPPPQVVADLPGYAGPEITLLLAELVENATKFSPSDTQVQMAAVPAPTGVTIEITDQGPLPMSADTYTALNRLLADPGTVSLREQIVAGPIGLLVASRLAQRHGVQVTLHPAEPEGTRATVTLPASLLMASRSQAPRPQASPAQTRQSAFPGAELSHRATPPLRPSPASPSFTPPALTAHPASAEPPPRSGVDQGRPALPQRRRASSVDGGEPAAARDAERGRPAGPEQQREHGHERQKSSMRSPVAGLLADFASATHPHTQAENPVGQGHSGSSRSAAQPISPPVDPSAEQSVD
ncbi:ATP-binding protein [Spirillospora sp. NPDC048819]|uniref:ATP-binding protein n=1 Tax=Spirillospora sp. NPDC048819 TaxID=3155268 RepID=UPI0033EF43C2